MRREREVSYHVSRFTSIDSYKVRRILLTPHNDRNPLLINQRYTQSLSELKRIKEAKISRIKDLVQKGLYDTPHRQIATARRITNILLAEKTRGN